MAHIKILKRKRLDEKLNELRQFPLTVVTAPMGFGKTTAVRTFLNAREIPYIWLAMTESIRIAASEYFWFLLVKGVRQISADFADSLQELGFPNDSVQISRIIDLIGSKKPEQGLTVVIDDYYLIENAQIDLFLEQLVLARIPWLHIVLVGRKVPEIHIEELKLKGFCCSIDARELSFTEEELENYFELIGFRGGEAEKQKIRSYASGWIAAIYLMVTSFSRNINPEFHHSIHAMLKSSFFDKYDAPMQDFLFFFSFFDRLTAEQAVYLFEDGEAVNRLNRLCAENAFIILDDEGWYRFHQIFLDFLREERQTRKLNAGRLIERAGEWYSEQEDHVLAFKYWMMAGNHEKIFGELERTDIRKINSIDRKLIARVFRNATEEQKHAYPLATLKYIWLVILNDQEKGAEMLREFEEYFRSHDHPDYTRNQILAESAMVSTAVAFNDAEKVIECSRKSLRLLEGKTSMIRNRKSVLTYGTPHFTYAYYRTPGEFRRTVDVLVDGFQSHIDATDGCGMGCRSLARAEYALETGELEQAELPAKKALYQANLWEQSSIAICARLTLARLLIQKNRTDELQAVLRELGDMTKSELNPIVANTIDNCTGYIYACLGQAEKIPGWLRNGDMTAYTSKTQGMAFNYIVYGKAVLLTGDYMQLEVLTETLEKRFETFCNQLGYIHNHIHRSVAKYHIYGMMEGIKELQKAIDIARQDSIVMPFAENAEWLLPMLKSGLLDMDKPFAGRLLELCEKGSGNRIENATGLSAREIEVILLLEAGKSQKEIADQLCISPNTVKRHIQNIYQKLDATNRMCAIKRFRERSETSERPAGQE